MFEAEEEVEHNEVAPDLSIIAKKNKALSKPTKQILDSNPIEYDGQTPPNDILNAKEFDAVFSEPLEKSSRRSKQSKTKKVVKPISESKVKKVKGEIPKVKEEKTDEIKSTIVKSVATKNSVSVKNNNNKSAAVVEDENDLGFEDNVQEKVDHVKNTLTDSDIEMLKEIIKLYLVTDEKCNKLAEEVKDYKQEKKQYEDYILRFMGDKNKEKVTYDDSTLLRKVTQNRPKPKEEHMIETLNTVFNDPDVAYEIVQKIMLSVPMEEKVSLKKIKDEKANKSAKK